MGWRAMLEPQTRVTLTELLRPPGGFSLSHAVGTTFTINLDTALAVPLSFAAQRVSSVDDPISILDAIRRVVDRVDLFAQAGEVSISYPPTRLVAYLEPMFHPVISANGIFHPKVWFLEFERGDERHYRYVCSSRNLTGDRSWDLAVSLDGTSASNEHRAEAGIANAPLVSLLRALPGLAVNQIGAVRRDRIERLADSMSGVVWERPDGIETITHHLWGIDGQPDMSFVSDRVLMISPFITQGGITRLRGGTKPPLTLISRAESLNAINPDYFGESISCFVIDDAANPVDAANINPGSEPPPTVAQLEGLHAKFYVFERGDRAHLLAGSLNATDAALYQNVEAALELVGRTERLGVDAMIASLGNLIVPHQIDPDCIDDAQEREKDYRLEAIVRMVAGARFHARVIPGERYVMAVWLETPIELPADIELEWYPLHQRARPFSTLPQTAEASAMIEDLDLAQVSPFIVLKLQDRRGPRASRTSIVIAELHDDPPDRREAVIASQFTDREAFLRFLMLLLDIGGFAPAGGIFKGSGWGVSLSSGSGAGLFEMMVRALGAGHSGLKEVHRIVEFLSTSGDDAALLPEGFDELWQAVWSVYQQLNPEGTDDQR
jgi:hypothetical protein